MEHQDVSRRTLLKGAGTALAGLTVLRVASPAQAFGSHSGEEVLPWLDQPPPSPFPDNAGNILKWEELDSWLTPADNFRRAALATAQDRVGAHRSYCSAEGPSRDGVFGLCLSVEL